MAILQLRLLLLLTTPKIACQAADQGAVDGTSTNITISDIKENTFKCKSTCPNGGTRVEPKDGGSKCLCADGFTGARCETDCLRQDDIRGLRYTGTLNKTRSGRTCRRWDNIWSMLPAHHFPGGIKVVSEAENFCRNFRVNSALSKAQAWCYTTDETRLWEYCDVPYCKGCRTDVQGTNYTGTVSTTNDGDMCFENGVCRNPNNASTPWCMTRDGRKNCDHHIPFCNGCMRRDTGNATWLYAGRMNSTKSGLSCQRWDQQTPHQHNFTTGSYFGTSTYKIQFVDNFCRDPKGFRGKPWCYTMSNATRWEFCDIPECPLDWYQ